MYLTSLFVWIATLLATAVVASGLWNRGRSNDQVSQGLQELLDDFWNWRMSESPEFASLVGLHDYDDRLDDLSLAAHQQRHDKCKEFLKRAQVLEVGLSKHVDLINLRAFKEELTIFNEGFPFKGYLLPININDGPHVDFEKLVSWMVFETPEDYEKLLSRLGQLPRQIDQIITLMRTGMKDGIVQHEVAMKNVAEGLGRFVVDSAEDSPAYETFKSFSEFFTLEEVEELQTRARITINNDVTPAYKKLRDFVKTEYKTRPDLGVSSLPNGERFYDQLIKFHTSTTMSVENIHQLGIDEVNRIEKEMKKIIVELGFDMTVPEFSEMIRNDSKFFFDNPEDLVAAFEDLVFNKIQPKLPEIFINIPKAKLQIVPRPSPDEPFAFYIAGSYDGSRPGIFYLNTYNYDSSPTYSMVTLSLHEGNPGHHLQASHALESKTFPMFRKVLEDRNYGIAPSRFPIHAPYAEGWGLYAETLGFDFKLYDDPYDRYGHYSDEIFRACRLVVDTGMHALGWTHKQAVDYLYTHTAVPEAEVLSEIDRYIAWPGQALGYKIGGLKIQELRGRATDQLGSKFDLAEFHDVVLESYGTLGLLEDEVDDWIASKLA
ncbi:uncharacterized protein LOC143020654 isoform X2 [Oratosquilla oratoria]|uniref:uncharacterized protein LOC143020654 isoform X2 n=1 Tax=Oratosquilla oratoria TaxID=337810 RepID=UPI003F761149